MDLGPDEERQQRSDAVMAAVVDLVGTLNFPPEVVFEGAVKGAVVTMIGAGFKADDVANLLESLATMVRDEGGRADGTRSH